MNFHSIHTLEPLYKRDSTGAIRIWYMEVGKAIDGSSTFAHRVVAGLHAGECVWSGWSVCEPKNVGRANETTSEQQAKNEVNSLYKKKQDKDYFYNITEVDEVAMTKPMLAKDYTKPKDRAKITFPCWAQPKLDGIRCIARADGLWSRTGKRITSCDHIWDELKPFFARYPDVIIDGELYNHDLKDNFNKITSLVRKQKPNVTQQVEIAKSVQYHMYDLIDDENNNFVGRASTLDGFYFDEDFKWYNSKVIHLVDNVSCDTQEELDWQYGRWLEEGYEGQMVRNRCGQYKPGGRSYDLQKRKEFITEEYEVIGILEGNGNWGGCVKHLRLRLPDGREFQSGIRGSKDMLREMWETQDCPDWATVRFFTPTPDGFPRFPVAIDWGKGKRVD